MFGGSTEPEMQNLNANNKNNSKNIHKEKNFEKLLKKTFLFFFQKVPLLASRAFSSSSRQLKNKVPEIQKLFQVRRFHSHHDSEHFLL